MVVLAGSVGQADEISPQNAIPISGFTDTDMHVHTRPEHLARRLSHLQRFTLLTGFLEVFAAWRTGAAERLPDIPDVLSCLTYLESQCPECTQIEWPSDD